jgi:hypothetical protein
MIKFNVVQMMEDIHLKRQDCRGKSNIQQAEGSFSNSDLNLRKKLVKCYIRSTELYGDTTWTHEKIINIINV